MNLKCVAIDDEPIALQIIEEFCKRKGNIEICTFSDSDEGLRFIKENNPQLVFLDIEMRDNNGLELASRLPEETGVIFTTAYIQYAKDGFNLDAIDYLHKPIDYTRFVEAINRANLRLEYSILKSREKEIIVKQSYNNIAVRISDILYIEAMENYAKIFLEDGRMVLAHNSLKRIMEMLPLNEFFRIHKSFVVSRSRIKSFSRQNVILSDGKELPVGRQYAEYLFQNI